MNSISFPNIFKANSVSVSQGFEATKTCTHLLLSSEQGELFGDPQFGIMLKKYTFNQNNYVLRDVLIDEIYSKLSVFCPQLSLTRNNITIQQSGNKLVAHIKAVNKATYVTNTLDLVLFNEEE